MIARGVRGGSAWKWILDADAFDHLAVITVLAENAAGACPNGCGENQRIPEIQVRSIFNFKRAQHLFRRSLNAPVRKILHGIPCFLFRKPASQLASSVCIEFLQDLHAERSAPLHCKPRKYLPRDMLLFSCILVMGIEQDVGINENYFGHAARLYRSYECRLNGNLYQCGRCPASWRDRKRLLWRRALQYG